MASLSDGVNGRLYPRYADRTTSSVPDNKTLFSHLVALLMFLPKCDQSVREKQEE